MIGGITNLLSNQTLTRIAQSTSSSVSIETGLKAVGRPSFILMDGDIEPETKKYAAVKEFIYQATCLATYMLLIIPVFKNGSFKIAKKCLNNEEGFALFKNAKEYLNYKKFASMPKEARLKALEENNNKDKFVKKVQENLTAENPEQYHMLKGAIEFGNIVGSVLGLAIFAPQISHLTIHPVLKLIGMEKEDKPCDND
jgi:hypothetical protein